MKKFFLAIAALGLLVGCGASKIVILSEETVKINGEETTEKCLEEGYSFWGIFGSSSIEIKVGDKDTITKDVGDKDYVVTAEGTVKVASKEDLKMCEESADEEGEKDEGDDTEDGDGDGEGEKQTPKDAEGEKQTAEKTEAEKAAAKEAAETAAKEKGHAAEAAKQAVNQAVIEYANNPFMGQAKLSEAIDKALEAAQAAEDAANVEGVSASVKQAVMNQAKGARASANTAKIKYSL